MTGAAASLGLGFDAAIDLMIGHGLWFALVCAALGGSPRVAWSAAVGVVAGSLVSAPYASASLLIAAAAGCFTAAGWRRGARAAGLGAFAAAGGALAVVARGAPDLLSVLSLVAILIGLGAVAMALGAAIGSAPRGRVAVRLAAGWAAAVLAMAGGIGMEADLRGFDHGDLASDPSVNPDTASGSDDPRALTEALLVRLYQAYGATGESELYDALATAADGPLIGALYLDRRGALVDAHSEGADTTINGLRLDAFERSPDPAPGVISASAAWVVAGELSHFGHGHQRINRYAADLTLAQTPKGWRLVAFALRDATRLSPDDGFTPAEPQPRSSP